MWNFGALSLSLHFQSKESPRPFNIPIPTPAPAHPLGDTSVSQCSAVFGHLSPCWSTDGFFDSRRSIHTFPSILHQWMMIFVFQSRKITICTAFGLNEMINPHCCLPGSSALSRLPRYFRPSFLKKKWDSPSSSD